MATNALTLLQASLLVGEPGKQYYCSPTVSCATERIGVWLDCTAAPHHSFHMSLPMACIISNTITKQGLEYDNLLGEIQL